MMDLRTRLAIIAQWHEENALRPVDVSGSDRARAQRVKFHSDACTYIRAAMQELQKHGAKNPAG